MDPCWKCCLFKVISQLQLLFENCYSATLIQLSSALLIWNTANFWIWMSCNNNSDVSSKFVFCIYVVTFINQVVISSENKTRFTWQDRFPPPQLHWPTLIIFLSSNSLFPKCITFIRSGVRLTRAYLPMLSEMTFCFLLVPFQSFKDSIAAKDLYINKIDYFSANPF